MQPTHQPKDAFALLRQAAARQTQRTPKKSKRGAATAAAAASSQAASTPNKRQRSDSSQASPSQEAAQHASGGASPPQEHEAAAAAAAADEAAPPAAASSKASAVEAFKRVFSGGLAADRKPARQAFDYLVVYDLEATCNRARSLQPVEIIELSCAIIHTPSAAVTASYQSYVRPTEHPRLDPFCTELTGIQQAQVDAAPLLADALQHHHAWLQQQAVLGPPASLAAVTWTGWDLGIALCTECMWRRIQRPPYLCAWVDLKKHYKQHYGRVSNLRASVEMAGLTWAGREHSGLDDATNTANLAIQLMRQGVVFKITQVSENPPVLQQDRQPAGQGQPPPPQQQQQQQPSPRQRGAAAAPAYDAGGRWLGCCYCGSKAKKRVTKRPGPNHGRAFWSCGNWRIAAQASSSCSFFMWADQAPGGGGGSGGSGGSSAPEQH